MVFDGDYPWDVRVEKMAESLLEAGHEVRLLCRNRARRMRRELLPSGLQVRRLPGLSHPLTVPVPASPIWAFFLWRELRAFRPDRILVRDLPLAPLAVALGHRAGVPVIADLAEPYPDSLRAQLQFDSLPRLSRWLRNPSAADRVERWVVQRIDRVLVVCPEAGRRLEARGLQPDRWTEVGNTPQLDWIRPITSPMLRPVDLQGRCVLFFSGLLAGDRGLEVALDALGHLSTEHAGRLALVIVGEGPVRASLATRANGLGLGEQVHFQGWVEHQRLPDWIRIADVGLLPFQDCPHINATLANKLFEYMALELPVIVSDVAPMARIIAETGAGVSFHAGDSRDLARAIAELLGDPERRHRLGRAGGEAVRRRYHWQVDGQRMLQAVARP